MKNKNVLFVAAVCVLAALTSCGGSKKWMGVKNITFVNH